MDEKDQEIVRPQRDHEPMESTSTLEVSFFPFNVGIVSIARIYTTTPNVSRGPSGIALSEYIYVTSSLLGYLSPSFPIE